MSKWVSIWRPFGVLVGLLRSPRWTRTSWGSPWWLATYIYRGRGAPKEHKFHAAPAHARAAAAAGPSPSSSSASSSRSCWCTGQGDIHGGDLLRDVEALPDSTRRRDLISPVSRKRCRIFIDTFPSSSSFSSTLRSGVACTVRVDTGGGVARAMLVRGIIHLLAIRRV